jgi:hypothetical protein
MNNNIYILVFALAGCISGCSKLEDFGDTNVNPAKTDTPVSSALLTNTLANLGYGTSNLGNGNNWLGPGLYCQYFSETWQNLFSCYASNQVSPMNNYSGALNDLQNIININSNEDTRTAAEVYGTNANQIAIARILKAYIYWTITDRWGDIPYKDALKGEPDVAFDSQVTIYKDLIQELTEAVKQFVQPVIPVKGDIAYNGDPAKWKKLANSLRMLMALNLSKQYPEASGYAAVQFNSALSDPAGSISDNGDNFKLVYPGGSVFRNPFFKLYSNGSAYGESETMTSLLVDTIGNDRRQSVFGADASGAASEKGVPYGRNSSYTTQWCQENPDYCYIFAPSYRSETSPLFLIRAASVLLARAEAADRGWTTENTVLLYHEGTAVSFIQWGLEAPEENYFLKTNVALGVEGANLRQIALQQYIAYYPDGQQGWNSWRRTGWPVLLPAPDATNSPKVIPRRYMYGSDDYTLNSEGIAAAVERLGPNGDRMDSRVWWDSEKQ